MKFNIRKIAAIGASALMIGMTAGVAAAASFPAPYSGSSATTVAVVQGSGAGVDDAVAVSDISTYLAARLSGSTTVSGGDSFKFEKTSTKFHLGNNITGVVSSSLDDTELSTILADGVYVDDDNDEFDYTQKIERTNSINIYIRFQWWASFRRYAYYRLDFHG